MQAHGKNIKNSKQKQRFQRDTNTNNRRQRANSATDNIKDPYSININSASLADNNDSSFSQSKFDEKKEESLNAILQPLRERSSQKEAELENVRKQKQTLDDQLTKEIRGMTPSQARKAAKKSAGKKKGYENEIANLQNDLSQIDSEIEAKIRELTSNEVDLQQRRQSITGLTANNTLEKGYTLDDVVREVFDTSDIDPAILSSGGYSSYEWKLKEARARSAKIKKIDKQAGDFVEEVCTDLFLSMAIPLIGNNERGIVSEAMIQVGSNNESTMDAALYDQKTYSTCTANHKRIAALVTTSNSSEISDIEQRSVDLSTQFIDVKDDQRFYFKNDAQKGQKAAEAFVYLLDNFHSIDEVPKDFDVTSSTQNYSMVNKNAKETSVMMLQYNQKTIDGDRWTHGFAVIKVGDTYTILETDNTTGTMRKCLSSDPTNVAMTRAELIQRLSDKRGIWAVPAGPISSNISANTASVIAHGAKRISEDPIYQNAKTNNEVEDSYLIKEVEEILSIVTRN